jgi:large subunit ribosomal protein L22
MDVKASGKYMHISAQKVRRIVGAVKGKPVETGLSTLKFMPQKSARFVEKILRSAVANADNRGNLDVDALVIKNVIVDEGPTAKRFRPRARGRSTRILKRTSHITVIVGEGSA